MCTLNLNFKTFVHSCNMLPLITSQMGGLFYGAGLFLESVITLSFGKFRQKITEWLVLSFDVQFLSGKLEQDWKPFQSPRQRDKWFDTRNPKKTLESMKKHLFIMRYFLTDLPFKYLKKYSSTIFDSALFFCVGLAKDKFRSVCKWSSLPDSIL